MKNFIFLFLIVSCTQKYVGYDLIRKVDFNRESYERPVTVFEVLPVGKDELGTCFNQWLFFSNAEAEKNKAIPQMVRTLCPGKDYLLDTSMTETWWTTVIFTRSCVDMETQCATPKKK